MEKYLLHFNLMSNKYAVTPGFFCGYQTHCRVTRNAPGRKIMRSGDPIFLPEEKADDRVTREAPGTKSRRSGDPKYSRRKKLALGRPEKLPEEKASL